MNGINLFKASLAGASARESGCKTVIERYAGIGKRRDTWIVFSNEVATSTDTQGGHFATMNLHLLPPAGQRDCNHL